MCVNDEVSVVSPLAQLGRFLLGTHKRFLGLYKRVMAVNLEHAARNLQRALGPDVRSVYLCSHLGLCLPFVDTPIPHIWLIQMGFKEKNQTGQKDAL